MHWGIAYQSRTETEGKARAGVWHGLGFSWVTQVAAPWLGVDWSQKARIRAWGVSHKLLPGHTGSCCLAKNRFELLAFE